MVKPATSKPGNSEIYVVCVGYLGTNEEVLESLFSHIGIYHSLFIHNVFTVCKFVIAKKDFLRVIV